MTTTTTASGMRRLAGAFVLSTAAVASIAVGAPAVGHADPGPTAGPTMGCEVVHYGVFWYDRRKVCDGPKQADGSWLRIRTMFNAAHTDSLSCLSNGDCIGGRIHLDTIYGQESYPVTDATVLPDEPGWLPPYTYNVL